MSPTPAALALLPLLAGAAPPVQLHLLPEGLAKERGAQCLDHTPAGYYIREEDPRKWLIWLEAGGRCAGPADCIARSRSRLGSSAFWDASAAPTDRFISPLDPLAKFSHVWVPYCSGDMWLGASPDGHTSLSGLQMSGHLILEALVGRLLNTTRLGSAADVVFGGGGAGGFGVYHHADWLADTLAAHARALERRPPRVVGLPVNGMFFPEDPPVTSPHLSVGSARPSETRLGSARPSWLPPACAEAQKKKGLSGEACLDVPTLLPYVETPLFIAQNRFGARLVRIYSSCPTCVPGSRPGSVPGESARSNCTQMNGTVAEFSRSRPQHGWFVPSDFLHRTIFATRGRSFRAAFGAWYGEQRQVVMVEHTRHEDGPCAPPPGSVLEADGVAAGQTQVFGALWAATWVGMIVTLCQRNSVVWLPVYGGV